MPTSSCLFVSLLEGQSHVVICRWPSGNHVDWLICMRVPLSSAGFANSIFRGCEADQGSAHVQSRRWVEDIASSWAFRRIIPAHFAAPVAATPQDLRCAP